MADDRPRGPSLAECSPTGTTQDPCDRGKSGNTMGHDFIQRGTQPVECSENFALEPSGTVAAMFISIPTRLLWKVFSHAVVTAKTIHSHC